MFSFLISLIVGFSALFAVVFFSPGALFFILPVLILLFASRHFGVLMVFGIGLDIVSGHPFGLATAALFFVHLLTGKLRALFSPGVFSRIGIACTGTIFFLVFLAGYRLLTSPFQNLNVAAFFSGTMTSNVIFAFVAGIGLALTLDAMQRKNFPIRYH